MTPRTATIHTDWLTTEQVMTYLGISRSGVERIKKAVPWRKAPGVGVRFKRSDIDRYLEEYRIDPPELTPTHPIRDRGTPIAKGDDVEVLPGVTRAQLKEQAGF